jgi:hypothetical protein
MGSGRVDGWRDGARWLDDRFLDWLAVLVLKFDNPQVEPFDFFEGDQVYFSEEFDDPGLIAIHARIMAVAVAGGCDATPGGLRLVLELLRRRGGVFW